MSDLLAAALAAINQSDNPFPGLRSFNTSESHLFFGRASQIGELITRLGEKRFLAVLGSSGVGKSSLVRAGLVPAMLAGHIDGTAFDWRFAVFRPGNDPIGNFSAALSTALGKNEILGDATHALILEAELRRGSRGLVEIAQRMLRPENQRLLVIVDQFEELFRHSTRAGSMYADDPAALIRLMLEAISEPKSPIYIVVTMRSEYLGECSRFLGLPEAMNACQYLVPRLTREELRQVIIGPARLYGAEVSRVLLNVILNEIINDQDQLPVLQHALMRTWNQWKANGARGHIELTHYESIGGLAAALSQHADKSYNDLPNGNSRQIAEKVFKALTGRRSDNREIRRPVTVEMLGKVADESLHEVISVITPFTSPDGPFLTVSGPSSVLIPASEIEITHESLIRKWQKLNEWVDEECQAAATYRHLATNAELHLQGRGELLRGLSLKNALEWKNKNHPNSAWASRYHLAFDTAMKFLEESEIAEEKELEKEEHRRKAEAFEEAKKKTATRRRVLWASLILSLFIVVALGYWQHTTDQLSKYRIMAAEAVQIRTQDPSRALSLAMEFWRNDKTADAADAVSVTFPTSPLVLVEPEGMVLSAEFSPDGRYVLTTGADKARLWDVVTGYAAKALVGHSDQVLSASFSPDGRRVVTASRDLTARVWDLESRRSLTLHGHQAPVTSAVFSSDGMLILTISQDQTARLWDSRNGEALAEFKDPLHGILNAALAPDHQRLVTVGRDAIIKIWNTVTHDCIETLHGDKTTPIFVAFTPDGGNFVTSGIQSVQLWNALSFHSHTLQWNHGRINNLALSPKGRTIAIFGDYGTGEIWDLFENKRKLVFNRDLGPVVRSEFSRDAQRVLTVGRDKTVKLWDSENGHLLIMLLGHAGQVFDGAFSPDGHRIVTASADHTAKLWRTDSAYLRASLKDQKDPVLSAQFSPDNKKIVTSGDNAAHVWDALTGELLFRLPHEDRILKTLFSPNGQVLVTASADRTAKLWNAMNGKLAAILTGHTKAVVDADFSADGHFVVTASADRTAKIWSLEGRLLTSIGPIDGFIHVRFSPDSQHILTTSGYTVQTWDARTGKMLGECKGHTGQVLAAVYSPDGQQIATASLDKTVRIWNAATSEIQSILRGHENIVTYVGFSPDGRRIITASGDQTADVWDPATGRQLLHLVGHTGPVRSAEFSFDSKYIVTASVDQTARVWDATTGETLAVLEGHKDVVGHASFSPDGQRILTASDDHTARIYQLITLEELAKLLQDPYPKMK
jgi:WD40 repeat protein